MRTETEPTSDTFVHLEFGITGHIYGRIFCLWCLLVHQIFIDALTRPPVPLWDSTQCDNALPYNEKNCVPLIHRCASDHQSQEKKKKKHNNPKQNAVHI